MCVTCACVLCMQGTYSRYFTSALGYVGVSRSASASPRDPDAAHGSGSSSGDGSFPQGAYPPAAVSPVLSPSRLHSIAIDGDGADSGSLASSTDISDDKENSARGPGGAEDAVAAAASAGSPPDPTAAHPREAVLSPSVRAQGPLGRTPPKVPPLVIPFPPPGSPHPANFPSANGSGYMSTPTPSTARPRGTSGVAESVATPTPPRPAPSVTTPRAAGTPGPPSTPRTASRIASLLSARRLISPMRSGGGTAAVAGPSDGNTLGLPPPSPQSDLSLTRFMHLIKNRKHATKAAQKLPQQFVGAAAQFAVKPSRTHHRGPDGAAATSSSAPTPKADGGADTPGAPRLHGRAALSAEAAVQESVGTATVSSVESPADDVAAAPAGSSTTPRWLPRSESDDELNFDDSGSSDDDFEVRPRAGMHGHSPQHSPQDLRHPAQAEAHFPQISIRERKSSASAS